jgi:predicted dienelactone hydrolase
MGSLVRAIFVIAPALGHWFAPASLASIAIPVRIVLGHGDQDAPAEGNASCFAESIKGARLDILSGGVGHYVFLIFLRRRRRKSCRTSRSIRPALTERRSTSGLQEWRSSSSLKP